jgi:hypothetical protein
MNPAPIILQAIQEVMQGELQQSDSPALLNRSADRKEPQCLAPTLAEPAADFLRGKTS